ncbi:MAG: hypothetical protein COA73_11765 [Candidatus Hydrogenedentota bacterium]|nr:MAG: hypothetical protein COA73_11765 [Candidatus Hydrogenedentota bacterium]
MIKSFSHRLVRSQAAILLFLLTIATGLAAAHPLGNFSINQYWLVDLRGDNFQLHYQLDIAEIPSFSEMDMLDTDLDTQATPEEIIAYLKQRAPGLLPNIMVQYDDIILPLKLENQRLEIYEGTGGMPVFSIFLDLSVEDWTWPQGDEIPPITFSSTNHENAQGYREAYILLDGRYDIGTGPWKEGEQRYIALVLEDDQENPLFQSFYNIFRLDLTPGSGETLANIPAPIFDWTATARSDGEMALMAKGELHPEAPTQIAQSPSTAGALRAEQSPPADSSRSDGMLKRVNDVIRSKDLTASMVAIALLFAVGLGMGHAFSPGHGKTVMAAYLIGERGTAWHAAVLGTIVTITHVWSVLLLGIIILYAGEKVSSEQLNFWTSLVSGFIIVAIGLLLFFRRYNTYLLARHNAENTPHHHDHDHHHTHDHDHSHTHDHDHHHHDHDHHHGPGGHTHVIEGKEGLPPTYKNILWLGISGGIVPCPAALIVLMLAINVGRLALGLLLIIAFSLGLASVLVAIGIAVVRASGKVRERIGDRSPLLLALPVISAVLITGMGIAMVTVTLIQFNIIILPA